MLGTNELGIEIRWKFGFLPYGFAVVAQPGTIFVDLGNKLDFGVIDHHLKESRYSSCLSALVSNPFLVINHILGPLNESYYRGIKITRKEMTFTFVTHNHPDWDGMVSFYACDQMIRKGIPLPEDISGALSAATDIIDQGKSKIEGKVIRPFLVFKMMSEINLSWEEMLIKGKRLIENAIAESKGNLTPGAFLDEFVPSAGFSSEVSLLNKDYELFNDDLKHSDTFNIFLPASDDLAVQTKALAFTRPPFCRLHKFWIRETTDTGLLIVPFQNEQKIIDRTIISVKPEDRFSLRHLGYELEKAETQKRVLLGKMRSGNPRFEKEYCDNADPWYDGRGHNYTIVDSPASGTVLELPEILNIIERLYSQPKPPNHLTRQYDAFLSYRREGGSDLAWAVSTYLKSKGKKVYMDVTSLQSGKFNEQLINFIRMSEYFLILLTPGTLDRCFEKDDWVLKEISEAFKMKKKIIPLMKPEFVVPPVCREIPEICELTQFQSIILSHEYFYSAIEKVISFMKD